MIPAFRRLRRAAIITLVTAGLLLPSLAAAQESGRVVEVVELRGPLDARLLAFAADSIERAAEAGDVEVLVLQLDSPGVVDGAAELERLIGLVSDPPLPLAVWVGPAPARAFGGAFQLLEAAPLGAVAYGAEVGFGLPTIAGRPDSPQLVELPEWFEEAAIEVTSAGSPGSVDVVQPSLKQFILLDLHGRVMEVDGVPVELSTVVPFTDAEGEEGVTNLPTVIREPNLWDQFLRLASTPDAAFFFLVAGLTLAAFEFFAIGPGIAAGVAAVSLLLAGYGIAILPVRWWSLALAVLAALALTAAHQMGGVLVLSLAGVAALTVAGLWFTDAAPQIVPGVPAVVLTVAASAFFFLLAMPTIARSRFSTQTIGREGMVGRIGRAVTPLSPDGEVEVGGARWRATSHREAAIGPGDEVVVTGVEGWYLEVDRPTAATGA